MRKFALFLLIIALLFSFAGCTGLQDVSNQKYTLTISSEGEGTTEPPSGEHQYDKDVIVDLTVTPDTENNWRFDGWGGSDGDEVTDNKLLMDSDKEIKAIFIQTYAPVLTEIGNMSVNEGELLEFTVSATDADEDELSYSASGEQEEYFDPETGIFSWTPTSNDSGNYELTFTVSDGELTDSETIIISVGDVDRPPVLDAIENKEVDENSTLSFTVTASDPDEDEVTLSSSTLPDGASFDNETGEFNWIPGYEQAGTYNITFTAEAGGLIDNQEIVITVNNVLRNFTLTTSISPTGSGTVTPAAGTHEYQEGTEVTLEGVPETDYGFLRWEGEVTDTNTATTTVIMDGNKTVTAVFGSLITGRVTGINSGDGIEGITINFSDDSSTTTDSEGYWSKAVENTVIVIPGNSDGYYGEVFEPVNRETSGPADGINFTFSGYSHAFSTGSSDVFGFPVDLAVDSTGNIFIADEWDDKIHILDSNGNITGNWGGSGTGDGQFDSPQGIAINSADEIFVVDSFNNRIQKFNNNGGYLMQWGSEGDGEGTFGGQFFIPRGIAINANDDIYIADTGNNRIQKYTSNALGISYSDCWGEEGTGNGQFKDPHAIAINKSSGDFYVADTDNHRFQVFESDGTFKSSTGNYGGENSQFCYPRGIAVDNEGNIYVADSTNHRIQVFDSNSNFIRKWGAEGSEDGNFKFPRGLAVDASGNIYVADANNFRIQKFTPVD